MSKPEKLKRVVIKEELVALTDDYIAALALCQFLYWSERRNDFDKFILEEKQRQPELNADLTHGWIYKSIEELHTELMLKSLSPSTLRRRVETLIERGWIDRRRNPQFKWDKTWQYRPNIFKIQRDLFELGYSLEGYPLQFDKSILQGGKSNVQDETSNLQGETALPEITSEITKQERENKDIEEFESFERHPASAFKEENPEAIAVPTKKSSAVEEVARQLAPAIDWVWGSSDASDKKLLHAAEELLKACGGDVDGTLDALDAYLSNPKNREWAADEAQDPHWLLKSVAGQYQKLRGQAKRQATARSDWAEVAERSQAYREANPQPVKAPEEIHWEQALANLETQMLKASFHHLFRDSYLTSVTKYAAVVEVRDEGVKEMLELRWTERVAEALGVASVQFEVMKGETNV